MHEYLLVHPAGPIKPSMIHGLIDGRQLNNWMNETPHPNESNKFGQFIKGFKYSWSGETSPAKSWPT
jgi:hypothetical protein